MQICVVALSAVRKDVGYHASLIPVSAGTEAYMFMVIILLWETHNSKDPGR